MLDIEKKSEPIANQFARPYFNQTDSAGIIVSACKKTIQPLSNHNIDDYLFKNLSEIFSRLGKTVPAPGNDLSKTVFPTAFYVSVCFPGKKPLSISWISIPSYREYEDRKSVV